MQPWLEELFNVKKPVIAMAHVGALPGTPRYDENGGVKDLIEKLRPDVDYLVQAGVNSIMFCNEDDRPYVLKAGIEQICAMTRIVTELAPDNLPFGADFLWDPFAALAIANATGASFVREVFTGLYESDMGTWAPNAGEVLRFRKNIGAQNVRVFFNIVPEFASTLGTRTYAQQARSVVVSSLPDVILVSGGMAGEEPNISILEEVKEAVGDTPVFLNTGAKSETIASYLKVVDGVIVGSDLKLDGYTWNSVDPQRVERFIENVEKARQPAY
jgi:membrane complex biogenesis BtpA family protein